MWEGMGLCHPGARRTCVQVGGHLAEAEVLSEDLKLPAKERAS